MTRPPTIAFIAGETSGDQLGGWLMAAIHSKAPDIHFVGLGGPMMAAQGLHSIFPMSDIALMGFAEILPHLRTLKRRLREMVTYIERVKPDILITIDSPGFTVRVVKALQKRGIARPRFIHYVAPTVWAYKPQRVHKMKANFDALLVLLPFESPYFEAVGLETHYVGHEIAWWWKTRGDGQAFRQTHALGGAPLLAVFPGSRQGEINRLWPVFKQSIEQLNGTIPTLQVAIQVPTALLSHMQRETKDWSVPCLLLANTEDKKGLFAAATAAIAKSGTIGLECALAGLPSIIAYRASALTAYMLRRLITVKFANLANLLAGRMIIPELIQENCTPEKIVQAVQPLLMDAHAREAQQRDLHDVAAMLGVNDSLSPSEKAAEIILKQLH
jgi:lipid-A-disaccharide synthase